LVWSKSVRARAAGFIFIFNLAQFAMPTVADDCPKLREREDHPQANRTRAAAAAAGHIKTQDLPAEVEDSHISHCFLLFFVN
jgi:hypothetical protein